jgi:hypothetical protein
MTTDDMLMAAQRLNLPELIEQTMEDTKTAYVGAQQQQMLHGLTSNGEQIGRYRSAKYAAAKAQLNPLAGEGNVDLRLTGAFFEGMFLDVRGSDAFAVDSTDEKSPQLQEKYGAVIFGLGGDYLEQYADVAQPALVDKIQMQLSR